MPTLLTTERHLDGLRTAMLGFVRHADRAGLEAPVPTCPGWTVRDLVAHQGMVHRWAGAILRGERPATDEVEGHRAAALTIDDPLRWLTDGATALLRAATAAPHDLDALVFLNDAPPARAFWARRQCHETTMHAVDALAAALGRAPRPDEVGVEIGVDAELAGDGIDELVGGFLTRPRSRLRCEEESLLVVRPDDLSDWWEVALGPRPATTTRHAGGLGIEPPEADWELTGTAVELYLRLWNRTDPPPEHGSRQWRRLTAVTWG